LQLFPAASKPWALRPTFLFVPPPSLASRPCFIFGVTGSVPQPPPDPVLFDACAPPDVFQFLPFGGFLNRLGLRAENFCLLTRPFFFFPLFFSALAFFFQPGALTPLQQSSRTFLGLIDWVGITATSPRYPPATGFF